MKASSNLKILDCSRRLPGPYASSLLSQLGHEVDWCYLRGEDFDQGQDPVLKTWFETLRQGKTKVSLPSTEELRKYQIIIAAPGDFTPPKDHRCVVLNLQADPKIKKLHDLNAMALTGLLKVSLNITDTLPFIPIGGVLFAHQIALSGLNAFFTHHKNEPLHETLYLTAPLHLLKNTLFSDQHSNSGKKSLHNGLYPCYNVFKTKDDHWLVSATIEKKFFDAFLELLNITQSEDQRFNPKFVCVLEQRIRKFTFKELKNLIGDREICVTLLTKD